MKLFTSISISSKFLKINYSQFRRLVARLFNGCKITTKSLLKLSRDQIFKFHIIINDILNSQIYSTLSVSQR